MTGTRIQLGGSGLLLALIAAATFGTSGTFATSLTDAGWTTGAAVTARITVATLVLTIPAVVQLRRHWPTLRTSPSSSSSSGCGCGTGSVRAG
jgi:hypothetical protein